LFAKTFALNNIQGTRSALASLSEGNLIDIVNKVALLAPVAYASHIWTPLLVDAAVLHLDQVIPERICFLISVFFLINPSFSYSYS
jgi:hypothetical protein